MHVPPDDRTYITMAVDGLQKFVRVLEADPVEPAALHGDRMVVQADHAVTVARSGEGFLQSGEALFAQATARRAGNAAIEQYDAPQPQVDEAADYEGRTAKLATHRLRLV